MNKKNFLFALASVLFMASSCSSHYELAGVQRDRILVDSRYDKMADAEALAFIAPYKAHVDSVMCPVVGTTAHEMGSHRPESELSNLLSDVLVWASADFGEKPDFAVYNVGGIRASLPKGDVTRGDVLDMAPFENKICFLTLTGEDVNELFSQIARGGGEGLSHAVKLVITADGKLVSASIAGKPVDPNARYRIATLDYVAQGNDHMGAFKKKTDVVSPQDEHNNVRFIIEKYFRAMAAAGQTVESRVEGRVTIQH